jgi:hypothetical protein
MSKIGDSLRQLIENTEKYGGGLTSDELQYFRDEGMLDIDSSFFKEGYQLYDVDTRAGKQPTEGVLRLASKAKTFASKLDGMLSGTGLKPTNRSAISMNVHAEDITVALDLRADNGLEAEIEVEFDVNGKISMSMTTDLSDESGLNFNPADWDGRSDLLKRVQTGRGMLAMLEEDMLSFRKFWPDFGKGR